MAVEDVELDRLVAPADRIGKPVRAGNVDDRGAATSVDRLGDFEAAILGEQDRHAHAAACPLGQRRPAAARPAAAAIRTPPAPSQVRRQPSGASRIIWQRERMVGSRRPANARSG